MVPRVCFFRVHGNKIFLCIKRGPGSSVGIATGYGLDGPGIQIPVGATFSAPLQTDPGAHPTSCTMGTRFFPGVKSGRGVTLTPHPLLVPLSWKSRAIPLLPLWAVRPVQSLSACTRVHFIFTFYNKFDELHLCVGYNALAIISCSGFHSDFYALNITSFWLCILRGTSGLPQVYLILIMQHTQATDL